MWEIKGKPVVWYNVDQDYGFMTSEYYQSHNYSYQLPDTDNDLYDIVNTQGEPIDTRRNP